MLKEVKPYKQKRLNSVISCMLMILSFYGKNKANWFNEKRFYDLYKSYYYSGTPFSAIAWHFRKSELITEIYHSDDDIFTRPSYMKTKEFKKLLEEYKLFLNAGKKIGLKVENGVNINCRFLKDKLENDYVIVLAGKAGNYLHSVVVCGYEDDHFIICDPLYKIRRSKTEAEMKKFMNNEYGISCICVNEEDNNE